MLDYAILSWPLVRHGTYVRKVTTSLSLLYVVFAPILISFIFQCWKLNFIVLAIALQQIPQSSYWSFIASPWNNLLHITTPSCLTNNPFSLYEVRKEDSSTVEWFGSPQQDSCIGLMLWEACFPPCGSLMTPPHPHIPEILDAPRKQGETWGKTGKQREPWTPDKFYSVPGSYPSLPRFPSFISTSAVTFNILQPNCFVSFLHFLCMIWLYCQPCFLLQMVLSVT